MVFCRKKFEQGLWGGGVEGRVHSTMRKRKGFGFGNYVKQGRKFKQN
jgi:hypothetical protein